MIRASFDGERVIMQFILNTIGQLFVYAESSDLFVSLAAQTFLAYSIITLVVHVIWVCARLFNFCDRVGRPQWDMRCWVIGKSHRFAGMYLLPPYFMPEAWFIDVRYADKRLGSLRVTRREYDRLKIEDSLVLTYHPARFSQRRLLQRIKDLPGS